MKAGMSLSRTRDVAARQRGRLSIEARPVPERREIRFSRRRRRRRLIFRHFPPTFPLNRYVILRNSLLLLSLSSPLLSIDAFGAIIYAVIVFR